MLLLKSTLKFSLKQASRSTLRVSFSSAAAAAKTEEPPSAIPVTNAALQESTPNPKLERLVDEIGSLTLLEVSSLVTLLKTKFNIKDIAMPIAAVPSAGGSAGANAGDAEAEKPKPVEKTDFTVILEKFDAASKAKIIREVKGMMDGFTLVQAKNFVESCPKELKSGIPKDEAEALKKSLEALGATIKLQ